MDLLKKVLKVRRPKPKYPILKEIASRFSPRYYSPEKIPLKDLKIIFEAARWTPSAHHRQPWYFYYAAKGTKAYQALFSTLNPYNQTWAKTAPLLILATAFPFDEKGGNSFAFYDLGAAVFALVLQAQSLGYFTRQIGIFDKGKVKELFLLPKNQEPFIILALGKIGDYQKAPKEILEWELTPRPRKKDWFGKLKLKNSLN